MVMFIYLSNIGKIEDFSDIRTKSLGYIEFFFPETNLIIIGIKENM